MDNYTCHNCMWEGTQDEVRVVMMDNPNNSQDHSLYEVEVCPDCGEHEQLVNVDEDRRYEEEAHSNWYSNEI
jgi:predicted RNA-binding Zn-ribbon protein involved in translation (DUF1610 family)